MILKIKIVFFLFLIGAVPLYAQNLIEEVKKGNLKNVQELISKGADVNKKNEISYTPLMYAVQGASVEMVKYLITKGANINRQNDTQVTPLMLASQFGNKKIVQLLIENGADINAFDGNMNRTSLGYAAQNGHKEVMEYLISKGAKIQLIVKERAPILIASQNGHVEAVKLLITKGVDPNYSDGNYTPVLLACEYGHKAVVEYLVSRGAIINSGKKGDYTPLMAASYKGHKAVVELLISKGADIHAYRDPERSTALFFAVYGCHNDIVELLIHSGADPNAKDVYGHPPLKRAFENGANELVDLLIANGAVDIRPKEKYAVINKEMVFLKSNANFNAKTQEAAYLGQLYEIHKFSDDKNWIGVSKQGKSFWIHRDEAYQEPAILKSKIKLQLGDYRIADTIFCDTQGSCHLPYSVCANIQSQFYIDTMDELSAEEKEEFKESNIVPQYTVISNSAIQSINEQLFCAKIVVDDPSCYSKMKYIGDEVNLLNDKKFVINGKNYSSSFPISRKYLFTTKLSGKVINVRLVYKLDIIYEDKSKESIVRVIYVVWPQCM